MTGPREARKGRAWSIQKTADLAGLSAGHVIRIEAGMNTPSLTTSYRLTTVLGFRLADFLNIDGYDYNHPDFVEEYGSLLRYSYYIHNPELAEQVAGINSGETVKKIKFGLETGKERRRLILMFERLIASAEQQTKECREANRWEYPGERFVAEELAVLPERLATGEAVAAVRELLELSNKELSKKTGISLAVLSKIENNKTDPSLGSYDKLARVLGLTIDELIYIVYPPRYRWPLFLPQGEYSNHTMVECNFEACEKFEQLSITDRAQLMVEFTRWLKQERKRQPNEDPVNTPPAFEIKLWRLVTTGV